MFLGAKSLVLREPLTDRYSHDLIAKKKAPMNNSLINLSIVERDILWN
jgi:hypothetical protein